MDDRHSLRRLREHAEALLKFHNAYVHYLEATHNPDQVPRTEIARLRLELTTAAPAAQSALDVAGINPTQTPPPAFGGQVISGLQNLVFLHERQPSAGLIPGFLIDTVQGGVAVIDEMGRQEARRRQNPLYWGDRFLRAVLGFPAYLISVIFRVPLSRIEESFWGTALSVATFIVGVLGLLAAAHGFGWI